MFYWKNIYWSTNRWEDMGDQEVLCQNLFFSKRKKRIPLCRLTLYQREKLYYDFMIYDENRTLSYKEKNRCVSQQNTEGIFYEALNSFEETSTKESLLIEDENYRTKVCIAAYVNYQRQKVTSSLREYLLSFEIMRENSLLRMEEFEEFLFPLLEKQPTTRIQDIIVRLDSILEKR